MTEFQSLPMLKLHISQYKMTVFWNIAPCSLVDTDRRFRGVHRLMMKAVITPEISHKNESQFVPM
jgi:hypothetical protein